MSKSVSTPLLADLTLIIRHVLVSEPSMTSSHVHGSARTDQRLPLRDASRELVMVHRYSPAVKAIDDMPSCEEIVRYWCERPLPGSDYIPLIDLGEPECFACGWCRTEQVMSAKALANQWKGLERAHVIPRSLGGSNLVENIILLCSTCHAEAPDTADEGRFWRWVIDHERNGSMAYLFQLTGAHDPRVHRYRGPQAKALRALASLSSNDLESLTRLFEQRQTSEIVGMMREAERRIGGISMHWGIGLSTGTIAEILREVLDNE